ncbi:MAG: cation:proton antiporter [Acidiferrobacterales bacterium]
MDSLAFIVIATCILGFGLVSGRVQKSVITPPMVFVLFGLLVSPRVFGWVDFDLDSRLIHILAELTLVLVLFTDASRIDLRLLRKQHDLPIRLLLIGLPLTVVAGALIASLVFDVLTFWEAAVLAAILAPTDAALGQAVVSSPRVPVRIRQTLNVESGLNDGIALPVILILLSVAGAAEHSGSASFWLRFTAQQVILGPLVGIAVAYVGGKLIERAARSGWINHTFQDLSALGLSLLAFAGAEFIGGNGFIAAFCAGLTLGNCSRALCTCLYEFAEAEGQLLTLLIFMVFGGAMLPLVIDHVSGSTVLYGLLSLTAIRMIPVAVGLVGAHLRWETVVFLGWFGPRGIASILFALLVVEESELLGRETILVIVMTTVVLSVFAHGLTAYPGANWYAARFAERKRKRDVPEHQTVSEMPVRLPESGSK